MNSKDDRTVTLKKKHGNIKNKKIHCMFRFTWVWHNRFEP